MAKTKIRAVCSRRSTYLVRDQREIGQSKRVAIMAEYTATFRSNYFAVKDPDKFRAFCELFGLEMITRTDEEISLYGFLNKGNESGIPFARYDQKAEDWELVDLIGILAEHLMPDYVAVILNFIGGAYPICTESIETDPPSTPSTGKLT
jgi:hypothetical protein